ncbi:patatin-like phospholipase family protein [Parapusillimonas granuli]|uniref:Patatin-like phospholipase family protein n=1 Tax=Parapusillimonas granuli TaxID=380911 RepID=A0A853G415_9BURK|nr:patatin-like phospholipase family protein [Parapusillimonas granuli]MBB5215153.1 NTE family protein [Parapusillimonas granuli]MEB2401460.1 patatin-like phospholipase family protein [Alcaligenaceae bacterium]NYT49471.1 patatin-like phospholipase family protein [Parapusillimonas granuli]
MPTHRALEPSGAPNASIGLVLTGGGARAAYQAGVLAGVMDILNPGRGKGFTCPFDVITGSSAGAINAVSLACHAHDPQTGMDRLEALWGGISTGRVYHADALRLARTGLRWFAMLAVGWLFPDLRNRQPRSLLDNEPLGELLRASLDFDQLRHNLDAGILQALAVTAAAYTTGEHLTFYQSRGTIKPWKRSLRQAVPCNIGVDHLMASSAIPFVFPAQAILVGGRTYWCGDGSMRQMAPMSAAIHLGAKKIMVIGTGFKDDTHTEERQTDPKYPSLAQIGGHALSNIFLDSVSMDVERTQRINHLLAQLPPNVLKSESLHLVSTLVVTPSRSLDEMALAHFRRIPRAVRTLFRVLGVSSASGPTTGGSLLSYLLFEASYTQELMRLGRSDSLSRIEEVKAFFKETPE